MNFKADKSSSYTLRHVESPPHVIMSRTDIDSPPQLDKEQETKHCSGCRCHGNGIIGQRKKRNSVTRDKKSSILQNEDDNNKMENKEFSSFDVVRSSSFIEELRKKKERSLTHTKKENEQQILTQESNIIKASLPTSYENKSSSLKASKNELVIVDDFDQDLEHCFNAIHLNDNQLYIRVDSITLEKAKELKTLLFGSPTCCFNNEWMRQGFYFSKHSLLTYGLIQDKGGPCGLLASVQAWVLKFLLTDDNNKMKNTMPSPTHDEQISALVKAVTHILWTVHLQHEVIVALSSRSSKFVCSAKYKADNLTEKLDLYVFDSKPSLHAFFKRNISAFCGEHGFVLFLYSAILSCGIEAITKSMDVADGTLMGKHGYCTQDMVNLLLTGKAVSNVFDGVMELGTGSEKTILHGIEEKSDIGFLSLFEHYESCKVGDNYKTPKFPLWVVCSESHFSVLFTLRHIKDDDEKFDLYYFDGLGHQDEEIRLSITFGNEEEIFGNSLDLIPPIDHCIRTKWKGASVSWNDTDPIL